MNATYRAPMTIKNTSIIIFAEADSGQKRIETLTDIDLMIYYFTGKFFIVFVEQVICYQSGCQGSQTWKYSRYHSDGNYSQ